MRHLIYLLSFFCLSISGHAKQPNVIIVMTDDQGYGDFACHGNLIAHTPHIDRFASQSIRLTDFHVSPMCTPTRAELMSGLDAFRSGASNVSSGRSLLRPELKTMAEVFKAAGYKTGIFGKWHLGDNYPFRPSDNGFEEALWFPSSHINSLPDYWDNDYFDDTFIHNGKRKKYKGYCTDIFFSEAMRWIKKVASDKQPFFTYLPMNAAHWPYFVAEKYREPIRQALRDNPKELELIHEDELEALISFLAMGVNIDENMGKLDQFLSKAGLKDNTIVVFLTDNGSTKGEVYFNAGMRGRKTQLWEGGHRVPCFIRWPDGQLGQPRAIDELSHVQDLLPTLADLASVGNLPAYPLDGVSLAPLFRGERQSLGDRILTINYSRMPQFEVTYSTLNPSIPQRDGAAVLWRKWRFLENRELYDVQSDPHQDKDVAGEHPEVVAKLRAHLNRWWDNVKEDVMVPQRVVIGSDEENPMLLSACEWLDVFVDQQRQVRSGDKRNGIWHLRVARPGNYTLILRRFPEESGFHLRDAVKEIHVTDGVYVGGPGFDIAKAKLQVGDQFVMKPVSADAKSVSFDLYLEAGETTLQTWFNNQEDEEILGAFFVEVIRHD